MITQSAANELLGKINEMLNAETRKFFRKSVQANIKKWTNQENKLTKGALTCLLTHSYLLALSLILTHSPMCYFLIERARLHQDVINDARNGRLEASITNDVGKSNIPLSEIIKREEGKAGLMLYTLTHSLTHSFLARLIEDYNRNWFEYEGFNLKEAFKSQTAKVNADWQIHETSITDEYNNKRKQLCKVVFTQLTTHSTHSLLLCLAFTGRKSYIKQCVK